MARLHQAHILRGLLYTTKDTIKYIFGNLLLDCVFSFLCFNLMVHCCCFVLQDWTCLYCLFILILTFISQLYRPSTHHYSSTGNLLGSVQKITEDIDFTSSYNFFIGFWNCSDSELFFVFFCFFFILSLLSLKEIDSNRRNENM
jgi:hypothetical protein